MAGAVALTPAELAHQVRFDALLYPSETQVISHPTARFAGRVTFGDASKGSDQTISVDIRSDFSGGGQIRDANEGSDQGRFWWATLDTRNPGALSLPREVVATTLATPATVAHPLGDVGGTFYATFDGDVRAWNETTDAWGAVLDTLDDAPVNRPLAFGATGIGTAAVLWVPQGAQGYQTFNGTTTPAQVTTVLPVAFAEFNDQLWALSTDGRLSFWDGAVWTDVGQLDARHTPTNLLTMDVRDDTPALHAITNRGVMVFDEGNNLFYPTKLTFDVAHPDAGLASATWAGGGGQPGLADGTGAAGGDLYWATATQIFRYTLGSTVAPIGPQRDHGLPLEVRGAVMSLVPEQNGLYALIRGSTTDVVAESAVAFSEPGWDADPFVVAATTAHATLMVWTGVGWHTAWTSAGRDGTPTFATLSGAASAYRLWWGYGGEMFTIALPRDFHLPRQGLEAGIDRFQPTGYIETAWFDAQMAGFDKVASHFQVNISRCVAAAGCQVVVKYMVDFDADWTTLGDPLTAKGRRMLSFGFEGVAFQRIRFRVEFVSDDPTESPLIDSLILHFDKIPHDAGAWEVTILLNNVGPEYGRDATTMLAELNGLLTKRGFVRFTLGYFDYRVRVASASGPVAVGSEVRGALRLSCIEVVDELDEPEADA